MPIRATRCLLAAVLAQCAGPIDAGAATLASPPASTSAAPAEAVLHLHPQTQVKKKTPKTATLATVVVSARHRDESLQQVPMAITALDAEELRTRGAEDLSALTAAAPNVLVYAARPFNNAIAATIRGVGQTDTVWGVEPGVGVYIDDVYLARPQAALLDVLDVERIEVLRGPQGTLYGKNTIGGAIRYLTRPVDAALSGSAGMVLGSYGRHDLKAVLNVPMGERLGARVSVASFQRDGFGHNLVTGDDVSARDAAVARVVVDWRPDDRVSLHVAWDGYRDRSGPRGAKRLAVSPFDPAQLPPDPGNFDVRSGQAPVDDANAGGWSATLDWTLPRGWQLKSISAVRRSDLHGNVDFDELPQPISDVVRSLHESQRSQEVRVQGRILGADALAGLYLFDGTAGGRVGTISGSRYLLSQGAVGTRSAALYADATWAPTARLGIEVGARYTREEKSARVLNQGYLDARFTRPNGVVFADFSDSTHFGSLSPRINVSWRLGDTGLVYAQVARGYKAGGYNIRANTRFVPASGQPFRDETATTFELGAKASWWDSRVVLDAALFRNRYRDIQLSVFTAYDSNHDGVNDDFFGDFLNAGAGTVDGAELELQAQPLPWLRVLGHAGYLDTHYDQYISGGVDIARSQRFTNAPRWSGGLSVMADALLSDGTALQARLDANGQSKVYPTTDLSEAIAQGGHGLVNASLTWRPPSRRWQLMLSGQNLTDRAYRVTGYDIPVLGVKNAFYGSPRTLSATLTFFAP